MDVFSLDWIGFILTGFGTLFLIGELLVNMRGFFGLIGMGFIIVYFAVYLETGSFIIMLIIYLIGILLIMLDGKVVNEGTLAIIGLACMLMAVALAAPSIFASMYAVIGVLIGGFSSLLFLKVFKRRDMWSKLTLKDQLTSEKGYNAMNQDYEKLLGQSGMTLSDLRPVGTIRVNHKNYSAVSNAEWISKDSEIKVVHVDGTKILVEKTNHEYSETHGSQ
ncbi:NfeD-like C-terminal, partner-binding [Lentibacillus halodurans]|uniref:NfeD-like C-terminal, partner-binding n=1 Tax=Lentibacillus halodurans TaxID=237679 RepID=A0A1I0V385_9BACI|nr:NfeD family protein [Lentibacillus halodurans]SFA70712.1 NfeD-like C-terminal, partner-binding [Lentibacillus halodurans]